MIRNLKKVVSLILMAAIMLSSIASFAELDDYGEEYANNSKENYVQIFDDVPITYWAFDYIIQMAERGILSGYPDGNFYPENYITRSEFAKIMSIAASLKIKTSTEKIYEDVETDDWCAPYIDAARYYLSGYITNGKYYYHPEDYALREDIAVALVKLKGYSTEGYDLSILKAMFTDWQSISSDAQKYVAVAVEKGLIEGYEDNTFRGQAEITRSEAATLLWRAYQYGNDNKVFDNEPSESTEVKEDIQPPVVETPKEEIKRQYSITSSKISIEAKVNDYSNVTITIKDNKYDGRLINDEDNMFKSINRIRSDEDGCSFECVVDTSKEINKTFTVSYLEKKVEIKLSVTKDRKYDMSASKTYFNVNTDDKASFTLTVNDDKFDKNELKITDDKNVLSYTLNESLTKGVYSCTLKTSNPVSAKVYFKYLDKSITVTLTVNKTDKDEPKEEQIKEVKKPYICDTIATASISDTYDFTTQANDGTVYYYDDDTNIIYKISPKTLKVSKVLDISKLKKDDIKTEKKEVTKEVPRTIKKVVEKEVVLEDIEPIFDSNKNEIKDNKQSDEVKDDIEITKKEVTKEIPRTITKAIETKVVLEDIEPIIDLNKNEIKDNKQSDEVKDVKDKKDETEKSKTDDNTINNKDTDESKKDTSIKSEKDDAEKDKTNDKTEKPVKKEIIKETVEEIVYEKVTEVVEIEKVIGTYTDFEVKQIYYNTVDEELYVIGRYTKYESDYSLYKKPVSKNMGLYRLDGKKLEKVTEPFDTKDGICGNKNSGDFICYSGYKYDGNDYTRYTFKKSDGKETNYIKGNFYRGSESKILFVSNGNNIYSIDIHSSSIHLDKYNFSQNKWEYVSDSIRDVTFVGMRNNSFYSWIEDGKIAKLQLDGKVYYLDIDLKNDVEVIDFKDLPSDSYIRHSKMYVLDDDTFIFYDSSNSSFRVIKER